jgi:hypothetical protein
MRIDMRKKPNIYAIVELVRCRNPYPADIFTKPTEKEYAEMLKVLQKAGFMPEQFFGTWGRTVWNNCLDEIEKILRDGR